MCIYIYMYIYIYIYIYVYIYICIHTIALLEPEHRTPESEHGDWPHAICARAASRAICYVVYIQYSINKQTIYIYIYIYIYVYVG